MTTLSQSAQEEIKTIADSMFEQNAFDANIPSMPGFKLVRLLAAGNAKEESFVASAHAIVEHRGERFCLVEQVA